MLENEVQNLNSLSTATLAIMCEGDRWTIAPSVSFPISDTAGESELPVADYEKSMALVTAATRTMQQKTSCATRPSEEPALDQPEQPARPAPDPNDQPDADATGHDHSKVSLEEMLGADKSDGEAGEADRFSKEAFQWAKSYNLGWKRGTRVPKKKKKKQHKGEGGKGNKDNGEAGEADQQKNTGAAPDGAAPDDASHVDGVSAGVLSLASAMFVIAILILGLTSLTLSL